MGAHNLSEYGNDIRYELADPDGVHSANVIDRSVAKMESLLARLIPKKNVAEARIIIDRTAEALVINSETGTSTYKPIKYDSESITTSGGTAMVRGTDYNINYMTGVVTKFDTGSAMSDGTYVFTYKQDPMRLDISSLVTNPIKITRIEYPVGNQPPTYLASFDLIEDYIIFHKDTTLTEGKFIRIYYDSKWTGATASTDGEYPSHLDDAIILGAAGQCLLTKAEEYVIDAVAELLLVNAAADSMATPLSRINEALSKVKIYLTDNSNDDAEDVLANITDDIAQLRTRIDAILSKSNEFLFNTGDTTDPSAKYYLVTGDGTITTVNVADRVPEKYADYARTSMQIFSGLVAEANTRVAVLRTYIEEAGGWGDIGDAFIREAGQRIGEVNAWAIQADKYRATSQEYLNIAGRYLASGQSKINEFYVLLGAKPELQHAQASASQATLY